MQRQRTGLVSALIAIFREPVRSAESPAWRCETELDPLAASGNGQLAEYLEPGLDTLEILN